MTVPCFEREDLTVTEVLRYFKRVFPHRYPGLKIYYPNPSGNALAVRPKVSYDLFAVSDYDLSEEARIYYGRPQIGWIATPYDLLVSMPFGMLASMCGHPAQHWIWNEDTDRRQIATWLIEHKFAAMYQEAANRHARVQMMNGQVCAVDVMKAEVGQVDRQIMHYIEQFIEEIDWGLNDLPGIVFARKFEVGTDPTKTTPVISCQYYFAEKRK